MNRRSFLKNSALALFGFSVLPPATTYQRIWKPRSTLLTQAVLDELKPFNPADYQGEWKLITHAAVEDPIPPIGSPLMYWFNFKTGDMHPLIPEAPLPSGYSSLTPSPIWTKA